MKALLVLLSGLLFASCMHMGMSTMDSGHQDHQGDVQLEKEVTSGDIKAVATFPPMEAGKEQLLTLNLSKGTNQQPVAGAEVYFHATSAQQQGSTGQSAAQHHAEGGHDINLTRGVTERSEVPGTYTVSYTPSEAGTENLMFHVASVGSERLVPPIVIEARRVITDPSGMNHGGMMMGAGHSTTTFMIIGGVLMAAMMVVMLVR